MDPPGRAVGRELATEALVLEPLRVEHAAEMVDVLADASLYIYTGGTPPTLDDLEQRYARQVAGSPRPGETWANWIIRRREDGRAAGYVQATLLLGDESWVAEVAWVVDTRYQRQGIATAATSEVMDHLSRAGVTAFRARIAEGHAASAGVARRLGLVPTDDVDDTGERLYVTSSGSG